MRFGMMAAALVLTPAAAWAQAPRPTVVELFTSQGCSSCPPADALVANLAATRPDILALTFHVTYWNRLGWTDPFSFPGATARQRDYVAHGVGTQVYTPAMVVDGTRDVVGSDGPAVRSTLAAAKASVRPGPSVSAVRQGQMVSVTVGAGADAGSILVVGYDRVHDTAVGRGENGGRTLREANIVRGMAVAGRWTGGATRIEVPAPAGEDVAVLVQAADGRIVGAARATQ